MEWVAKLAAHSVAALPRFMLKLVLVHIHGAYSECACSWPGLRSLRCAVQNSGVCSQALWSWR